MENTLIIKATKGSENRRVHHAKMRDNTLETHELELSTSFSYMNAVNKIRQEMYVNKSGHNGINNSVPDEIEVFLGKRRLCRFYTKDYVAVFEAFKKASEEGYKK